MKRKGNSMKSNPIQFIVKLRWELINIYICNSNIAFNFLSNGSHTNKKMMNLSYATERKANMKSVRCVSIAKLYTFCT